MRIRQLHYFMALAKYLNFKLAANALNIAQSGLSQQIAELEYELGFKLFYRDNKTITLSAAGWELMQRLPEIFKLLDQSMALMQDSHDDPDSEILHIGFETPVVADDMAVFVSAFQQVNPNVYCMVNQYSFEELTAALKDGRVDVGFFLMPSSGFGRSIDFQTVVTDALVLVMRQELLAQSKAQSVSEVIANRPLFCFEKNAGGTDTLLSLFHEMQIVPDIHYCTQIDELICNVESGLGYSILPKRYVDFACQSEKLLTIDLSGLERSNLCLVAGARTDNASPAVLRFLSSLPRTEPHCGNCLHINCHRYLGVKPML